MIVCSKQHSLKSRKSISLEECLKYDFVGLNCGSSLLELTSRQAEKHNKQMRLRIQVRSYDAMCQMIAVNLGIGILPLQACAPQIKAMNLKVINLEDLWANRQLLVATKADGYQSPASALLSQHILSKVCRSQSKIQRLPLISSNEIYITIKEKECA